MLIDPSGNSSLAFTLFAAECEGDVSTFQGKRNKLIKNLRKRACYSTELGCKRQYNYCGNLKI